MTPDERRALEHRAERSLRRGELQDALASYRSLASAFPLEQHLVSRLAELEASLQAGELSNAKSAFRSEPSQSATSPTHQAEALAAKGDFDAAIGIYRALLTADPAAELLKERLAELFQLAQARRQPRRASQRAPLLEELLERIQQRKRQ